MRAPAGWHPDPEGRADYRWWDGTAWTSSIAAGGVTMIDLEGTPSGPPPDAPGEPTTMSSADTADNASRMSTIVTATVAVLIVVLVVGIIAVVRHGDDRADRDAKARADLRSQVSRLSNSIKSLEGLHGDIDELRSAVDSLSRDGFGGDGASLSDFTDFGNGVDACTLLTPDDVTTALGTAVHVDRSQSFGSFCVMSTDAVSGGTGIFVETARIDRPLQDLLLNGAPGVVVPRPLQVGDESYVTDAYGIVAGIAAKGRDYVMIVVQSGSGQPADEQMAQMLAAAVARL
jgi:hypothetical protein